MEIIFYIFSYIFQILRWLFWPIVIGIILFLIFSRSRAKFWIPRIPGVSYLSLFVAVLIFIGATILFNVIWADITDLVRPEGVIYLPGREGFALRLRELFAHTFYVLPLLVVAIVLSVTLEKKGVKYRVVTFPYLAAAGIMAIRLVVETGYLAIRYLGRGGLYGVLIFTLVIFTALIFYIQQKWEERKKQKKEGVAL